MLHLTCYTLLFLHYNHHQLAIFLTRTRNGLFSVLGFLLVFLTHNPALAATFKKLLEVGDAHLLLGAAISALVGRLLHGVYMVASEWLLWYIRATQPGHFQLLHAGIDMTGLCVFTLWGCHMRCVRPSEYDDTATTPRFTTRAHHGQMGAPSSITGSTAGAHSTSNTLMLTYCTHFTSFQPQDVVPARTLDGLGR
ncbi:hypothetical protein C8J57DRAFT_1541104 [Mycena rebaudengoi]|nr:hypothetical protein C8J57DRAFT_1541104 [Mycena rebaudengoi]